PLIGRQLDLVAVTVLAPIPADMADQEGGGVHAGVGQGRYGPAGDRHFPQRKAAPSNCWRSSRIAPPPSRNRQSVQAGQSGAANSAPVKGSGTSRSSGIPHAEHLPCPLGMLLSLTNGGQPWPEGIRERSVRANKAARRAAPARCAHKSSWATPRA